MPTEIQGQVSTFSEAPKHANQIQMSSLDGQILLEFRSIIPELPPGVQLQGDTIVKVDADIKQLAPHTRITLPPHVAIQLRDMLNTHLQVTPSA